MRFASLVLAFAFLCTGPSVAGSADAGPPHIGSFAFHAAPVAAMPAALLMASVR